MLTLSTPSATWASAQTASRSVVFRDELAGALDQDPQHVERLGIQGDRARTRPQAAVLGIEPEAVEAEPMGSLSIRNLTAL